MVGLLFGIHPLTVGRVAWVTERKTVLTAFFAFWSLVLYVRYTRTQSWKVYSICLLAYLFALLSKPTSLPVPAVMLLLDYWPLRRLNRRAIWEKLPFFAVGALHLVVAYISFERTAQIVKMGEQRAMQIPKIICYNIIFYLYKIVWPVNLSVFYSFPKPLSVSNPMVLAGVIGTCLLIPLLLVSWRWTRALLTGWLIFFVAIFSTLGVIGFTDAIAANRFVYFPSIGLLLILAWGVSRLWQGSERGSYLRLWRIAISAMILILAVLEAVSTRAYLVHWQDTLSHFQYMLALEPQSAKLNYSLGLELAHQQRDDEAIKYFSQTIQLDPGFRKAYNNLGVMLAKEGKLDKAITYFNKAIQLKLTNDRAHHNLARALYFKGELGGAIEHYKESLRLEPESTYTMYGLSWILATSSQAEFRDGAEAVRLAKQACELSGYKNPVMLDVLAAGYAETSNFKEAVKFAQKAIDLCLSAGQAKQAEEIAERMALYKVGKPCRAK